MGDGLIACAIYVLAALMWLVPDRRIERVLVQQETSLEARIDR